MEGFVMRIVCAITFCFPAATLGMAIVGALRYDGYSRAYFIVLVVPAALIAAYLYLDVYMWATSTRRALPAPKKHVGTDSPLHETANSAPFSASSVEARQEQNLGDASGVVAQGDQS